MPYVITCGDEGVQINEGTRLAIVGAGLKVEGVETIFSAFSKLLGEELRIAASGENTWVKEQFELDTFEQADATMQQKVEALADKNGLLYSGFLPFADPKELAHEIKGHMVRPRGMHLANKIEFTLAGGEQTYHLGHYLISAEWIHAVDEEFAKENIAQQVAFYKKLAGDKELGFVFEAEGPLGDEVAQKNRQLLEKWGYSATE